MDAAITTSGLAKKYGAVIALEDLSLRVERGEVFGFLGPNGAGKTTTIRLLLGLLRCTSGSGTVLGAPIDDTCAVRRDVGYLPGELTFWPGFTGWHTLRFLERLGGRPAIDRLSLLDRLGLTAAQLRRPVRTYSDGMKQKLGIVQALQCRPKLAFLDEPTKGLDPLVQQAFYEVVAASRDRGMTVFFSSHVLPEVERVCDRIAMLRAGRLATIGSIESVLQSQRRRVRFVLSAPPDDLEAVLAAGQVVSRTGAVVEMMVARAEIPALLRRLAALPVSDVTIEPVSLEEAFLEHYR